ncbi:MAG TPA: glycosyltransferase family 4 protein, partial [Herpetosiphonaceae bacterium]
MARSKRILVCTAQTPFARGGAELLAESLVAALRAAGHQSDLVALPFTRSPHRELLSSALAWRMLDLTSVDGEPVDQIICTKFPSYVAAHPRKTVWLVHQYRQLYDWRGTAYSDWGGEPGDDELAEALRRLDRRCLGETPRRFAISKVVSQRLARFTGLRSAPLYPPSPYAGKLRRGPYGAYVLSIARLDRAKRIDLLLRALAHAEQPVAAVIAGTGPERERLERLAADLGLGARVSFRGWIGERELIDLYAGARAVFYAPVDEDYGFSTIEALEAARPVVTATDAGGVLEFVEDGGNGLVAPADPRALAARLDLLWADEQ